MGAQIEGAGTSVIRVEGVPRLTAARTPYARIGSRRARCSRGCCEWWSDRAGPLSDAALDALIAKLREAGCKITTLGDEPYAPVRIKPPAAASG